MVTNYAAPTEAEAIMRRCERWLGGHGYVRPRAELAALVEAVGEDEEADIYGKGDLN